MDPPSEVLVGGERVWLVVVNSHDSLVLDLLPLEEEVGMLFIELGDGFLPLLDCEFIFLGELFEVVGELDFLLQFALVAEWVFHERLILDGHFPWGPSVDAVGVIPDPNQEGSEHDADIKGVSLLSLDHVGRGGDDGGKFVGRVQLLKGYIVSDRPRALPVIIQIQEPQLRWTDRRADELIDLALVLRSYKDLPVVVNLMELVLELKHMLQHQLLFRSVLQVAREDVLPRLVAEVPAPHLLLVDHLLLHPLSPL